MPDHLEQLADEARRRGLHAVLRTPLGRPRRVRITTKNRETFEEVELAEGQLRWPWGDLLPGATAVEQADALATYFAIATS